MEELKSEELKKEFRIRIEPPPIQSRGIPLGNPQSLPAFYYLLLFLTYAFCGVNLYSSFGV